MINIDALQKYIRICQESNERNILFKQIFNIKIYYTAYAFFLTSLVNRIVYAQNGFGYPVGAVITINKDYSGRRTLA